MQNLLVAVEAGRVKRIFVEDVSRLSRDKEDAARIEKILEYHGVAIVTLDGMTSTEASAHPSRSRFRVPAPLSTCVTWAPKTRRGLRGAHREGKSTGGRCYGYTVVEGRTAVEEVEASVVRRIFRMYLDGLGYAVIAQKLDEQCIPAPRTRRRAGGG